MGVIRLRHKLVLVFLAATLLPLAAILWMSSALMSRSLAFIATDDVAALAQSLEQVGREYYRQARQRLKDDADAGRVEPQRLGAESRSAWPPPLQQFWDSGDAERFILSEPAGDRLQYATRRGQELWLYTASLDGVRMSEITRTIAETRTRAGDLRQRDLPRGFTLALVISSALVWTLSLAIVLYLSVRISRPIQQLTTGLGQVAAGRFETRLPPAASRDEIGQAVAAFNTTADRLQRNRERLIYLTQVASWQMLARKMAHELKNSLTPIRLTVEEIVARQSSADAEFFARAAAIVVDEVTSLERRVRAFSEFAAEPETRPTRLDLGALVRERVELLRAGHPGVGYEVRSGGAPAAWADADQVKGILTNLLENAAEAAGDGGSVLIIAATAGADAVVEVHDSGPGVSAEVRSRLFEPAISFKKHGMGLGLAISRKNALLAGGDLSLADGQLGGAAFRLVLPSAERAEP